MDNDPPTPASLKISLHHILALLAVAIFIAILSSFVTYKYLTNQLVQSNQPRPTTTYESDKINIQAPSSLSSAPSPTPKSIKFLSKNDNPNLYQEDYVYILPENCIFTNLAIKCFDKNNVNIINIYQGSNAGREVKILNTKEIVLGEHKWKKDLINDPFSENKVDEINTSVYSISQSNFNDVFEVNYIKRYTPEMEEMVEELFESLRFPKL